jgi:hypothetical protein
VALQAGLHVLCEKPLVWRPAGLAEATKRVVEEFAALGLHLEVNTQWPETLPAYRALFPGLDAASTASFEMRLSPSSTGYEMLVDAMPHALSLLGAAVGHRSEPLDAVVIQGESSRVDVRFSYPGAMLDVDCRVLLETCVAPPRPAAYGFDGDLAHRVISEPGYRLSFRSDDGREVPFEDPMRRVVASFLAHVCRGFDSRVNRRAILDARHLQDVLDSWEGPIGVVGGEGRG